MAIDADAAAGGPYHIVANLPYNVGTALFTRWLEPPAWPPSWRSLTLMFQQEVAERIVAPVGTPAYGRLSVLAQWRATARIATKVHRSAFTPRSEKRRLGTEGVSTCRSWCLPSK